MVNARPFLAAAVLALCAPAAAADSLLEAVAKAYLTNPGLEAQRARLRAADEGVAQAGAGGRPNISAAVSAGVNDTSNSAVPGREETRVPGSVQLTASQPLYRGGRTDASVRRADHLVEAERAGLLSTEQSIFLNVGTTYVAVVRDQAVIELNVNNEKVLQRQLEATRDRFEVGEVTRTDVSQAQARLARTRAERTAAEGMLEISRAAYERLVGKAPGTLSQPEPLRNIPATLGAAVAAAENNPQVARARSLERAARYDIAVLEGELLPSLNLVGTGAYRLNSTAPGSRVTEASLTARLTVPLYSSGSVRARLRAAKQTAVRRRFEVEDQRRTAVEQATRAWATLESARVRLRSLAAEIDASEIALEGVRQEALVGTRTVLDVLDAEQELLDAKVQLVRTQRNVAVASYQLAEAAGLLTVEAQGVPADPYDYRAHYDRARGDWWGSGE